MEKSLKSKTFNGVLWRICEVGSTQIVQFVVSIFLARLILPAQFGAIAMLTVFTSIMSTFIDCGFCTALMRKENRTQEECSTVFFFNITIALVCYGILFVSAPWIASFYEMPELKNVLRVVSVSLIISAFSGVQNTLFSARMDFKILAKYNVLSSLLSGIFGIFLAYKNFQVWALVAQSLTAAILNTLFLWFKSSWRPSLVFSFKVVKEYFAFGSKLLMSALLDNVFNNLYQLVIGKVFKASDLAFYNRARTFTSITATTSTGVLRSVTFPALCKVQNDMDKLRYAYRNMLRLSAFIIFPLCVGCGAVSYPLINVLYTDTWIFSASLLQIIVFASMWYPIHAINLNLLVVKGRSELFLKLEVIKKILSATMIACTFSISLKAMCYGMVATSLIALFINTHYTGKILSLPFSQQMKDIAPSFLLTMVMFAVCKLISTAMGNGIDSLICSVCAGAFLYLFGAWLLKLKELQLLKDIRK